MDEPEIYFDSPLNQSSYIKVIGVGGGGGNAVNHMYKKGITGVDFIVCNTDMKALNASPVPNKLVLGSEGLGVGGRPTKACKAAEGKEMEIKSLLEHDTKMIFITAGMGGGTGTGAAPVIARFAKEIKLEVDDSDDPGKILVVAVVTTPFKFEGARRIQQAYDGVEELRKYVDSILVIDNEKLRTFGNLAMSDAFSMANDVLLTAVKGIAEIITLNALINIDFRDVNTVMENSGTALMGIGEGQGENRARQAVEEATTSVLLCDNDISGAKDVLLYLSYGPEHELTMDEMGEVTDYLTQKTGGSNVIWGTGSDESLGEKVKITLIATGFEKKETPTPQTHVLPSEPPQTPITPVAPSGTDPFIVKPSEPVASDPVIPIDPLYKAQDTPTVEPERKRNIIPLDDELPTTKAPQAEKKINLSDISIVSRTPAADPISTPTPAVAEKPAPVAPASRMVMPEPKPAPVTPATTNTSTAFSRATESRAERIKRINFLLRNEENGPSIVEQMNAAEEMGNPIYETKPSSESEATASINADGTVGKTLPIYELPD